MLNSDKERIAVLEEQFRQLRKDMDEKVDKESFIPIKNIAYGFIAIILGGVISYGLSYLLRT